MVLLFRESITAPRIVLTLCTPGCARTHSIAIDLITSKVRYSLWFTSELFTYGLRTWLTHARYANSRNQTVRQTQVHSESSAGQIMGSWHPGSAHMRDALPSPDLARDFKTSEFRRNCRATYGIVTRGPIHSIWKQYPFHLYKSITTFLLHAITHNGSEMHRIVGIPIIAHSSLRRSLQPLSGRTFVK